MPGKKKNQFKTAKRRKARRAKTPRKRAASTSSKSKPVAAVLDSQKLQDLYAVMLKARILSEKALPLLSTAAKGPPAVVASKREAVLVGAIAHMLAGDSIATAQSSFLADFIKSNSIGSVLEQLHAAELEVSGGTSNHNETGSFAEVTMERGIALANGITGTSKVVVVFPGEYPAGPVIPYESLGFAASNKLPLVCVMESTWSRLEQLSTRDSAAIGAHSFPRITVDGNDVVAVFRVAQEAVRRARAGHGPSLIECVMPESDSAPRRKHADTASDPLEFMQQYLQRRNLWADEWQRKIADQFSQELELAIASTAKSPDRQSAFDRSYASDRPVARSQQNLPTDEKNAPSRA